MDLLLVGEAPGRDGATLDDPRSRSGKRLTELGAGGLPFVNILDEWPGPASKGAGFEWNSPEVQRAVGRKLDGLPRRPALVFLGLRAARAFDWRGAYFEWGQCRGRRVVTVPHPSGVNRWWNEPANVRRARRFFGTITGTRPETGT